VGFVIPIVGFTVGFSVGRWWAIFAAVPFGGWIVATNNLDGHIGTLVAGVLSGLLALAIAAGVALRRLQARKT